MLKKGRVAHLSHTHQPAERCSKAKGESEGFGCGIFDVFLLLHPLLLGQQMKCCVSLASLGVFHCLSPDLALALSSWTGAMTLHRSCGTRTFCSTIEIREGSITTCQVPKKLRYFTSTCRKWEDFLLYQKLSGAAAETCNLKFICDRLPYYKN